MPNSNIRYLSQLGVDVTHGYTRMPHGLGSAQGRILAAWVLRAAASRSRWVASLYRRSRSSSNRLRVRGSSAASASFADFSASQM